MPLTTAEVSTMYINLVLRRQNIDALDNLFREKYAGDRPSADASRRYTEFRAQISQQDIGDAETMNLLGMDDPPLIFQDLVAADGHPVPAIGRALLAFIRERSEATHQAAHRSIYAARAGSQMGLFSTRKTQFLCWLIEAVDRDFSPPPVPGAGELGFLREMTTFANMDAPTYKELVPQAMNPVVMNRHYWGTNYLAGGQGIGGAAFSPGQYSRAQLDAALSALKKEKAGVCTNFGLATAACVLAHSPRARVQVMASGGHVFVALEHRDETVTDNSKGRFLDLWWGALGNRPWSFRSRQEVPDALWAYMDGARQKFASG